MIATGVQNVGWEDSYLLGWREQEGELRLYVQVLLSDRHVGYRSFNEEQEHGCYRLGILRFGATSRCVGLPEKQREPRWECGLN